MPRSPSPPKNPADFWSKVDQSDPNGCWIWTGWCDSDGYGRFNRCGAHRIAWVLANGPIPAGLLIRHMCHNPPCCNPCHLKPGTSLQNFLDMLHSGRADQCFLRLLKKAKQYGVTPKEYLERRKELVEKRQCERVQQRAERTVSRREKRRTKNQRKRARKRARKLEEQGVQSDMIRWSHELDLAFYQHLEQEP